MLRAAAARSNEINGAAATAYWLVSANDRVPDLRSDWDC